MKHVLLILPTFLCITLQAQDYIELSRVDSSLLKHKVAEVHTERHPIQKVEHPVQWETTTYNADGRIIHRETKIKDVPLNTSDFTYEKEWLMSMDRKTYHLSRSKEKEEWIGVRDREKYGYNRKGDSVFVSRYIFKSNSMEVGEVLEPYGIKHVSYNSNGRITFMHEKQNTSTSYSQYKFVYDSLGRETYMEYELWGTDTSYYKLKRFSAYLDSDSKLKTLRTQNDSGKETWEDWVYELNAEGKILSGKGKGGATLRNIYYPNGLIKQSVIHRDGKTGWIKYSYKYRE